MSLDRLRLLGIILPMAFLLIVQGCSMLLIMPSLGSLYGHVWSLGVFAGGVVVFSTIVFRIVGGMQRRIVRQNEELSALNAVSTAVSGSLELEEAVDRALGNVADVTGALAAEIVVEASDDGEPPLTIARGEVAHLRLAAEAVDSDHPHAPGTGQNGRALIVSSGDAPGAATFACVPLIAGDRVVGVMRLLARPEGGLQAGNSDTLLAALGNQIAIAIQARRLFRDVAQHAREAEALYEIGLHITSLQSIQSTLQAIVERARELAGSEAAALCFVGNGDGMALASRCGPEDAFSRAPMRVPPLPTPAASSTPNGDANGSRTCQTIAREYRACHLSTALRVGGSTIGELCVSSREPRATSQRQRQLLAGLADMAAIAINNARLLEGERNLAVLEERQRLAREMHDSLAQVVGYLHLKAQVAKRALARWDSVRALDELEEITSLAHEAYVDVRAAILDLRETVSPSAGIVRTLEEYVQQFRTQTGIRAEFEAKGDDVSRLPPEVEVQLLRVIQEAMTNVRKHAHAGTVRVRVSSGDGHVSISVEDDGRGFDPAQTRRDGGRRFGLEVMRERVERAGGRFEIDSAPGRGTAVRIHFDLREGQP